MNYNYTVPVVYSPEDNASHIGNQTILVKDCSIFGRRNEDCPDCPNDDNYCQPYIPGDTIYFQIPVDINQYNGVDWALVDSETGVPFGQPTSVEIFEYPEDEDSRVKYFSLSIDTTDIVKTCWYIRYILVRFDGEDDETYNTASYCTVKCNEETLLVQGAYTSYDCDNNYYGDFRDGSPSNFLASMRVRGVVEPNGYTMEKTLNGNLVNKSKQSQRFTLFTEKIPYYVVKKLAIMFNSKQLTIDGIDYKGELKLDKNFEEGSEWIIKEDIFIDCDELNFTCN